MEHADPTLTTYLTHGLAGSVFAISGAYAQQFCEHFWHRLVLGTTLVVAETMIVVTVIG